MAYLQLWDSPEKIKSELSKRLQNAMQERLKDQRQWEINERTVFNRGGPTQRSNISLSFDVNLLSLDAPDNENSSIGTNYSLKNVRLIHAQLSANPPAVIPRPTSNDPDDRRRADAADRIIRYAMRQYGMQEKTDMVSLSTLIYGTGFVRTMWDTETGDIVSADEETGKLELEGDYSIDVPNIWNIYMDSDASTWEDVRYIFERVVMPYEQACFMFPDKKDMLEQFRIKSGANGSMGLPNSELMRKSYYDSVELFMYWEKGLPVNGMLGRFCWCTNEGTPLMPPTHNPERYKAPKVRMGNSSKPDIAKAVLPYHIFTDLDVPGRVYGKSSVEFASSMQDSLNRVDSVTLENIKAHGVARLILPEGTEIADDSITNSPYDIIRTTGTQPPHFAEPMPLPAAMTQIRETMRAGIDDMFGVNESMFGQQSREQSGFSMQYATNQGNMIRRRLFNKYVLLIESMYKRLLMIVQKHWSTPRTIHVLGKEKAFEVADFQGADIAGGYDLVVEYGTSLSLDPISRREEIMTMMPLFEKAGVSTRDILSMVKLNELGGMYDVVQMASDRQREYFEEMIATGIYLGPRELEDHPNMLAYAYGYIMTVEYKYLKDEEKALVDRHIREREQLEATKQASAQAGGPPGPLPMGINGELPVAPGMAGPTEVSQAAPLLTE
jgi:hypothetical protein